MSVYEYFTTWHHTVQLGDMCISVNNIFVAILEQKRSAYTHTHFVKHEAESTLVTEIRLIFVEFNEI